MKKHFLLIGAAVAAACIGGAYWYCMHHATEPLTLYGNIDIRQVNMAFRVDGRLTQMNFEEGDRVKAGDTLALLDSEPIANRLAQAKAQAAQSAVNLDHAQTVHKRRTPLCKSKTISVQECDDLKTNVDAAQAALDYANSVVAEAQTAFNDATLTAPSDGIILIRILEPGSLIKAGVPVYTISLNNQMWVRVYLKETDLGQLKIGDAVQIYTDSTNKVYDGHIGFISSQAEFTPKNIETASLRTDLVYRTRIIIDNPDDLLKQGMPVTVRVKDAHE